MLSPERRRFQPLDTAIVRVASDDQNARAIAAFTQSKYAKALGLLVGACALYFGLKGDISHNTAALQELKPEVEDMRRNGHADHEHRIQKLENEKASKEVITAAIEQQTRNIGELKDIVKTDHDTIVGINARLSPAKQ